jgi:hypothetical protein
MADMVVDPSAVTMFDWLEKFNHFKEGKKMKITYVSLSAFISLVQIFFAGQLGYKYLFMLVMKPDWFFEGEDEEEAKESLK